MGCCFSKPVPKPPEPTLPRSTARAVKRESPDAGSVNSELELQATDILNVKNLSTELTTITDWYQLGLYLNLQTHELNKIQQDHAHQGNDRQMVEMLAVWLQRTPNATWGDMVNGLQQMEENRVAENIRQKHLRRASK